jgi:hypothetical protein
LKSLGPDVVTGAADDDPSGIATYSVAGAQLGTKLLWTALLTWPLMAAFKSCVPESAPASVRLDGSDQGSTYHTDLMAEQLAGGWYANLTGLGDLVSSLPTCANLRCSHAGTSSIERAHSWGRMASSCKWRRCCRRECGNKAFQTALRLQRCTERSRILLSHSRSVPRARNVPCQHGRWKWL